ncbi:PadR family transcriptional regulator [Paenibacillus yanchengensis]|uniref:PadR family transcriptional regulator n=1 Tax=Paenibacillus yanchengensis TaxID=2035833 RepID=A0ABW4YNQ6_9BACL
MEQVSELVNSFMLELRRGTIILAVLGQLRKPEYGYSLVTILETDGFTVEPGTLYPLLRRLEKQGVLVSEWDTSETRPRKYYLLSELGIQVYEQLCVEWTNMIHHIETIINKKG